MVRCLYFEQVFKHMRKNWWLGLLGLFSIYGVMEIIDGNWMGAAWLLWLIWFVYFIPEKKVGEKEEENRAYDRSTNEKVGNNKKNSKNNGKLKGIVG